MTEEREPTPARERRVEELFDQALELASEARAVFLEHACAGDESLRREVQELLEVARGQASHLLPPVELPRVSSPPNVEPALQGLSLAPGMQVGDRYRLLRMLGRGGMGTVFLAQDRRLHRRVAIKFLHATTQEMAQRFLVEARATARCRHENIVVIHDVDEVDGCPYMVLEYLEGEPLRERFAGVVSSGATAAATPSAPRFAATSPAIPVAEVLELIIPVVRALVCAHRKGIVHRDLKPENVFLCKSGIVKVLDFGIVKMLTDAQRLGAPVSPVTSASTMVSEARMVTQDGAVLGTVSYMSPEQWTAGEIDERTDIWAVGIMLYEMLAGRHPLAPLSYGRLMQLVPDLDTSMPAIGDAVTGLGALADLVDGCLRKRPTERIASARELLDGLVLAHGLLEGRHPRRDAAPPRTGGESSTHRASAVTPTLDPLALKIDDALRRKQRLEAAGQLIDDVLAELRQLKREYRRGGRLRLGDELGDRYLLVAQIGRGGFATVWRARDGAGGDDVAIKVLHPETAGDLIRRQRFFRGARIMAELAHPMVVKIREQEAEDDGFFYFVMDYISGGNLRDAVLAGRVHGEQAVPLILGIGEGLAAAHARGHVHRDVKPANILLTASGEPRLTDFDLVTAQDTTGGTRTGALGTFLYAPPEMMDRPQEADARADIYGLGMTLAFMLHGDKLPRKVLTARERFIESLGCTPAIKAVLQQATAEEPEGRHSDATVFCEALRAAASHVRAPSRRGATSPRGHRSQAATSHVRVAGVSAEEAEERIFVEPTTGLRFLWVPGGTFWMGSGDEDEGAWDDEKPRHQVQVSAYWLAETPVTNRQYAMFLSAIGGKEPSYWADPRFSQPEQPVVGVSWLEAKAFCVWLSEASGHPMDLPTEAQWERAARGEDGRKYPWGDEEPDNSRAWFGKRWDIDGPLVVGSLPGGRGPYGHLDLAGNIWEWCRDAWHEKPYRKRGELTIEPVGPSAADDDADVARACRGGAFDGEPWFLRCAFRLGNLADGRDLYLGFRVAAVFASR